jgi:hypothetical protein
VVGSEAQEPFHSKIETVANTLQTPSQQVGRLTEGSSLLASEDVKATQQDQPKAPNAAKNPFLNHGANLNSELTSGQGGFFSISNFASDLDAEAPCSNKLTFTNLNPSFSQGSHNIHTFYDYSTHNNQTYDNSSLAYDYSTRHGPMYISHYHYPMRSNSMSDNSSSASQSNLPPKYREPIKATTQRIVPQKAPAEVEGEEGKCSLKATATADREELNHKDLQGVTRGAFGLCSNAKMFR